VQREEIKKAQKFLRDWYGIEHTPQLMPKGQQQIQALEQTPAGKQFDQVFLEVFASHHFRAMTQSQECRVKADIAHEDLKHYCEGIVGAQTRQRIAGKAHHVAGARYIPKLGGQIQQADLVFDDILRNTTHGVTPWRLRAGLIKIRTSIKPGNPTFGKALLYDQVETTKDMDRLNVNRL
jgi:hypothetical protein